ncbi:alpha/beta fold hydrolase [Maribacter sp. ACAM166]|uniref:alpha/beta fold hydrolase n=1 Tax=Maribacter sp. ACAM166 TaxID=2508996 RepID=UPI0010FD3373|nr:alpha/beta fold hydrolase [Maribacter sp. ACAM166]TLP82117.1 alpha/beta hydrolase [Maribacter sp. ACAM166]
MPILFQKIIPKLYGLYFNLFVWLQSNKIAKQAFEVFATVRKGRVLPNQKQYLDSAKLEVLNVGDNQIQLYRWPGTKETVVLVHGWESNAWRWHRLIEKLQEADYNIIAFDAPAHGYSTGKLLYVPIYAEALQAIALKYRPKTVIGHSVGGMTVLYNEYKHSNAFIEKIVTIGSPSEFNEILTHYKNLLGLNKKVMKTLESYIYSRFGFTSKEFSSSKFVLNNSKKGLLFHDRLDKVTPYHASVEVNKHWKGSELISTEGFGHSMHQDEVNDKIITFLKL